MDYQKEKSTQAIRLLIEERDSDVIVSRGSVMIALIKPLEHIHIVIQFEQF